MNAAILTSGKIKSGKSSVSRVLARQLCASYTSFGDEVRRRAEQSGLDPTDRNVLQDLGQELVAVDPDGFIESVLARATPPLQAERDIVIDGLRHIDIVNRLRKRLESYDVFLLYVETPVDLRRERATSGGEDAIEWLRAELHVNEADTVRLHSEADLVVPGDDDMDRVVDLVRAAFLRRSKM